MITELYVIRHAEPDRSTGVPYNLMPGPPLTLQGEQEAIQAGHWMRQRGIERLLSSPFTRARATAETIAQLNGLDLTLAEHLREGAPGERHEEVRARVAELLAQIDDSPAQRVALVTHGCCVLAMLQNTTNESIDLSAHRYDYGNPSPTAGIWYGMRGERTWRWEFVFRPGVATEH